MFSAAKAFHAYGLGNSLTFPMSVGRVLGVCCPTVRRRTQCLQVMRQHNPSLFGGVPTLYAGLLANPFIMPGAGSTRLRGCISAGEALPEDIGKRWKSMVGVDILDGIGSTEMLHIFISNRPDDDVRYGSTGKPVPGYEARIVDEHDRPPFRMARAGELVVSGDSAADGYWNQRAKTRRTFQRRLDLHRRHLHARCRKRLFPFPGPQRRDAEGQRRLGVAVRGRGSVDRASRRCWRRR